MNVKTVTTELWRDFKVGLIFLTRLPVRADGDIDGDDLARASRLYPLVGAVVGLVGGLAFAIAAWAGLTNALAAILAVAATLILTGAFHEDGLGDVADGFGGAFERERKLAIMKDSRIGTYGAAAILFSLLIRAGGLTAIAGAAGAGAAVAALVAVHAAARASLPVARLLAPEARTDGLSAYAAPPQPSWAWAAAAIAAVIGVFLLGPLGTFALAAAIALAGLGIVGLARRQIGGITGDVLGTVEQAGEMAGLVVLAALAGQNWSLGGVV